MLKRNDLVIKMFFALYFVRIYVKYMHMCVHLCTMNQNIYGGAYVF